MQALFSNSYWLVPLSVFFAGLLGSAHCVSMCGPLVVHFARQKKALLFYQAGRIFSYTLVGAIAGSLGQSLFDETQTLWLSRLSLLLIALVLLVNAYRTLYGKSLHWSMPSFLNRLMQKVWRSFQHQRWSSFLTAGLAGFLTVFLPCGHLYSFLIGAMATGSALAGATFMLAFGLGSAPLLSLGGRWLQKWIQSRSPQRQRLAGILLLIAGLYSVFSFGSRIERQQGQVQPPSTGTHQSHSCH